MDKIGVKRFYLKNLKENEKGMKIIWMRVFDEDSVRGWIICKKRNVYEDVEG